MKGDPAGPCEVVLVDGPGKGRRLDVMPECGELLIPIPAGDFLPRLDWDATRDCSDRAAIVARYRPSGYRLVAPSGRSIALWYSGAKFDPAPFLSGD